MPDFQAAAQGWKTGMVIQKFIMKRNSMGYPKEVSRILKVVRIACIAAAAAMTGCFTLPAQAAPATLRSPDAAVYEQADEGSGQVGNLVEGSTFEYIGDVTAEDGSVWHQITTSSGAAGYIRGDRELEIGAEEPAPDPEAEGQGGQEAPGGEGGNAEPEGNTPEEAGAGENPGGEAGTASREEPEDDGGGEEEIPEEDNREEEEDSADNDDVVAVINMQNIRTKNYTLGMEGKIKERGSFAGLDTGNLDTGGRKAKIDKTLFASTVVVFFCAGAVYICLGRMRRLKWEADGGGNLEADKDRVYRKIEKKKRSQKKKAKKAAQARKEKIKIQKEIRPDPKRK